MADWPLLSEDEFKVFRRERMVELGLYERVPDYDTDDGFVLSDLGRQGAGAMLDALWKDCERKREGKKPSCEEVAFILMAGLFPVSLPPLVTGGCDLVVMEDDRQSIGGVVDAYYCEGVMTDWALYSILGPRAMIIGTVDAWRDALCHGSTYDVRVDGVDPSAGKLILWGLQHSHSPSKADEQLWSRPAVADSSLEPRAWRQIADFLVMREARAGSARIGPRPPSRDAESGSARPVEARTELRS